MVIYVLPSILVFNVTLYVCVYVIRSYRVAIHPLLTMREAQTRFLADKRRISVWLVVAWQVTGRIRWAANQTAVRKTPTFWTAVMMQTARPLRANGLLESHLYPVIVAHQIKS